jgi:hypothetical protein
MAVVPVNDVLEEKGLALRFRDSSAELPPNERMKLRILVDRVVDPEKKAFLL